MIGPWLGGLFAQGVASCPLWFGTDGAALQSALDSPVWRVLCESGAAHRWARIFTSLGHTVRLVAAETVRPFVKKGKKNDAVDAAAICEAASRLDMKFVAAKSVEQQGILALHAARSLLIQQQTMLANAMRGLATEFGQTVLGTEEHCAGSHYLPAG